MKGKNSILQESKFAVVKIYQKIYLRNFIVLRFKLEDVGACEVETFRPPNGNSEAVKLYIHS